MNYLSDKILSAQKTIYIFIFVMFCYEISTSSIQFQNIFNPIIINDELGSQEKVEDKNIRLNNDKKTNISKYIKDKIELKEIEHNDSKILIKENLIPKNNIGFVKGEFNSEEIIIIEYVISHPEVERKKLVKEIKKIFKVKGIKKSKNQIESMLNSLDEKNTFK
jgi:hypothetical protein